MKNLSNGSAKLGELRTFAPEPNPCVKLRLLSTADDWKQFEAEANCAVTQRHTSDLLQGRVSKFAIATLTNIATAIGSRVHVEVEVEVDAT